MSNKLVRATCALVNKRGTTLDDVRKFLTGGNPRLLENPVRLECWHIAERKLSKPKAARREEREEPKRQKVDRVARETRAARRNQMFRRNPTGNTKRTGRLTKTVAL